MKSFKSFLISEMYGAPLPSNTTYYSDADKEIKQKQDIQQRSATAKSENVAPTPEEQARRDENERIMKEKSRQDGYMTDEERMQDAKFEREKRETQKFMNSGEKRETMSSSVHKSDLSSVNYSTTRSATTRLTGNNTN
jgi:hypothetical protein